MSYIINKSLLEFECQHMLLLLLRHMIIIKDYRVYSTADYNMVKTIACFYWDWTIILTIIKMIMIIIIISNQYNILLLHCYINL